MTSIEKYNRRLREKKFIVGRFAICPVCKADKLTNKKPCSREGKCPYNVERRGRRKTISK